MLSIILNTEDVKGVERFCDALKRFIMATSWGGYESLLFPLCALAGSESFAHGGAKGASPMPWSLVRLYIGLEDADLLIEDLRQALEKV